MAIFGDLGKKLLNLLKDGAKNAISVLYKPIELIPIEQTYDYYKFSNLTNAVENGNLQEVQKLLANKHDPNIVDPSGILPIEVALQKKGNQKIILELVAKMTPEKVLTLSESSIMTLAQICNQDKDGNSDISKIASAKITDALKTRFDSLKPSMGIEKYDIYSPTPSGDTIINFGNPRLTLATIPSLSSTDLHDLGVRGVTDLIKLCIKEKDDVALGIVVKAIKEDFEALDKEISVQNVTNWNNVLESTGQSNGVGATAADIQTSSTISPPPPPSDERDQPLPAPPPLPPSEAQNAPTDLDQYTVLNPTKPGGFVERAIAEGHTGANKANGSSWEALVGSGQQGGRNR